MSKHIIIDKNIVNGNPHIQGTRTTVFDVVIECDFVGVEKTITNLSLSSDVVYESLDYCSKLKCVLDGEHCGGCLLRNYQDKVLSKNDFIHRFNKIYFEDSRHIIHGTGQGNMLMPESPRELSKNWKGVRAWLIATKFISNKFK